VNSDFEKVVVKLEPHPNADTLSLVRVGDFQVVVKTENWKDGDEACYVYPDALVDVRDPAFHFLAKVSGPTHHRVKAVRLRGERSFGLLVPWREDLGGSIGHWNPPETEEPTRTVRDPGLPGPSVPKYDLDNGRRFWRDAFFPGEQVIVTEKIHGENARYVWTPEYGFQAGSRTRWVGPESHWHTAADEGIRAFCEMYPRCVLFGELYGKVGGFPYDAVDGRRFRAFDVYDLDAGVWWEWEDLEFKLLGFNLLTVPVLDRTSFDPDVAAMAEGKSVLNPGHVREGVVVSALGRRAKQKWVGFDYLSLKG